MRKVCPYCCQELRQIGLRQMGLTLYCGGCGIRWENRSGEVSTWKPPIWVWKKVSEGTLMVRCEVDCGDIL